MYLPATHTRRAPGYTCAYNPCPNGKSGSS